MKERNANIIMYFLVSMSIACFFTTLSVEQYGLKYTSIAVFLLIYGTYLIGTWVKYLDKKKVKECDNQMLEIWFSDIERNVPKIKQVNRLLLNPIYSHKRVELYSQREEYISKALKTIMLDYQHH